MADVTETQLPGVGVRFDFTTDEGDRLGVVAHRSGRRELLVYDHLDPDRCASVLQLRSDDARTLAELLGASQVQEVYATIQQQVEGLAIEWITVSDSSEFVGRTIADGAFRTRTGASIVAVVRGTTTIPAPEPDHAFEVGEVVVAVGTGDGLAQLAAMLDP